jgi:hypothetical protein
MYEQMGGADSIAIGCSKFLNLCKVKENDNVERNSILISKNIMKMITKSTYRKYF